jgi:hypothetical protein
MYFIVYQGDNKLKEGIAEDMACLSSDSITCKSFDRFGQRTIPDQVRTLGLPGSE